MAIAVNDILRISANMLINGVDQNTNIYNLKVTAVAAPSDFNYMQSVSLFLDTLYLALNPEITTALTYVDIDGINVTKDELLPSVPWFSLTAGVAAAKIMPLQDAICVFFRTTRPKTRASKFLGGWTSNALQTDGTVSAAVQVLVQAFGDALVVGMAIAGDNAEYGAFNQPLSRFTSVDSAIVPVHYRTQRRRRQGVGS